MQGNLVRNSLKALIAVVGFGIVVMVAGPSVLRHFGWHKLTGEPACPRNLKRLVVAIMTYCYDNDDMLPSSALYNGSKTWNREDFIEFARGGGTFPPELDKEHRYSWSMAVYPYLKNKDAVWCPSDPERPHRDPSRAYITEDTHYSRTSYYWKAAVDAAWFGGPSGSGPRVRALTAFVYPADQMILYEHSPWHMQDEGRWHRDDTTTGLQDGAWINCLFLDGHVQKMPVRESGYAATDNPTEPLPASGIGEPAWFNYSFGAAKPAFSKGQNWNPKIWGDRLR